MTMKQDSPRCHLRVQKEESPKQKTIDDNFITDSSTSEENRPLKTGLKYLVESFTLCSIDREVNKKGKIKRPGPRFRRKTRAHDIQTPFEQATGRKVQNPDLSLLGSYFEKYVELVNLVLERVYSHQGRIDALGEELHSYRGQGYVLLKKEEYLTYSRNEEVKAQCFERMYRNVLEQAARVIHSNWMRRQLMLSAITSIKEDRDIVLSFLKNKYIPAKLAKVVRESCECVKNNGSGYYYSLSVLKQLRKRIDEHILSERGEPLGSRKSQRRRVSGYLRDTTEGAGVLASVDALLQEFIESGYSFETPRMFSYTGDFSASTENSPGQGYWYSRDPEKEHEIFFFLKLPEPLEGTEQMGSPYRTNTLPFRFLNWLPRAAKRDREKAKLADKEGKSLRARKLRFRARRFEDMQQQLINTIELQHATYQLARLQSRRVKDTEKIKILQEKIDGLREARTCGPPRLLLRGHRVELQIPFLPPTREMLDDELGTTRTYHRRAGADRGVRVPIVLSVRNGEGEFVDELVACDELLQKRDLLREQTKALSSQVKRMRNNWDRKYPDHSRSYPDHLLKKERHLTAIWRKIRRLDREIARQVASQTVWFCEMHGVKMLYFENLKNYTPAAGYGNLSWRLSSNLWSKVLDTVRYMRQSLGHKYGGIWTVSPAWTSQKCHVCGERGIRVEKPDATDEYRGGEFFHCENCGCRIHADVNAARNIIDVKFKTPSAVSGQTTLDPHV